MGVTGRDIVDEQTGLISRQPPDQRVMIPPSLFYYWELSKSNVNWNISYTYQKWALILRPGGIWGMRVDLSLGMDRAWGIANPLLVGITFEH
jgi:hypothetical protein